MKNKTKYLFITISFFLFANSSCKGPEPIKPVEGDTTDLTGMKLAIPENNKIYHSAFPDLGGTEDIVTQNRITDFETLANKQLTWVYFSNNWTSEKGGIKFPSQEVSVIHNLGRIPFIRMMPRSNFNEGGPDPVYTMQKFIDGNFDNDLKLWAKEAKNTKIPLLVEFGTEVNGDWFPWNAEYNGRNTKNEYGANNLYDGMERFRDAYRHIIDICNNEGAINITWFFHIDIYSNPETSWNNMKGYYPGDDYIDWIGISVYGKQEPNDDWNEFQNILNDGWNEVKSISATGKPIAILEWGVVDNEAHQKPQWITNALNSVKENGNFYPEIKAVSYWNENFGTTLLRIDSSPEALNAYKQSISNEIFISSANFN